MPESSIALKVDVDTYRGTRDGVPGLLRVLDRFGIKATFYFSIGPDNSGKAIRRIFTRKGFLKKMLRTKAPSLYGPLTMLYGTLLPAPMIAASFPDILKETFQRGHEVGIHCWDHVRWHDFLPLMSKEAVAQELGKAFSVFEEITGVHVQTTAAPGWEVSSASLEVQDALNLSYCSDCRGTSPFYPVLDGKRFSTLQIPTTLPTMDELLGYGDITTRNVNDLYLSLIKPGLNVHTIHAEMEGISMASIFVDFVENLQERQMRFITLSEAAGDALKATPPCCSLHMREIQGRAGKVATQGEGEVDFCSTKEMREN